MHTRPAGPRVPYSWLLWPQPPPPAMVTPEPTMDGELPPASSQMAQRPEENVVAFASLLTSLGRPRSRPSISKFVKKLEDIPKIILPPSLPRCAVLSLSKRGLVGQFTRL